MSVLSAILADSRQVALDVAWIDGAVIKWWREQKIRPSSRRISRSRTDCMACCARRGSAAPEITPHDCAIESIWHSRFRVDPSGVPSS